MSDSLRGIFPKGYETVLPYFYDVPVEQFVLDYANREMADIEHLKSLPKDKEVQVGVLDVRTSMIETPEEIANRIKKVIKSSAAGPGLPEHRLRDEAAALNGSQNEVEGARGWRRDHTKGALASG